MVTEVAQHEAEQVVHLGVVGPPGGQVLQDVERVVREATVITELGQQEPEGVVVGALAQRAADPGARRFEVALPPAGPRELA